LGLPALRLPQRLHLFARETGGDEAPAAGARTVTGGGPDPPALREARRSEQPDSVSADVSLADATWTCHVCGDERPDEKISVHSKVVTLGGIKVKQNVRYCNDRAECVEGARHVDWLRGPASYDLTRENE
jgi:hypothetical protein